MSDIPAVPRATYRLQFGPQFTFRDAAPLVPYLHELGVSHVYASPIFKARPGTDHGYDITDHNAFNPELGTPEDFDAFSDALRARGMGLILDFVPNHMGIGKADNEWWLDLLEWGQSSVFADFFDIDWMPRQRHLQGKLLVPFLGDHYGAALERGEIELRFDSGTGTFSAWYHEHRFPIRPRHYAAMIRRHLARPEAARTLGDSVRSELERLAAGFDKLRRPGRRLRAAARAHALALKAELAECCGRDRAAADFVAGAAAAFNGTPGDSASFLPLHALLERQVYRLAFWRAAADEVNYRRFFNINELAGIRMENPTLFETTHRLVGRLMGEGRLQGLRLDHIDGLFDPEQYCRRLRQLSIKHGLGDAADAAGPPLYMVIEKILARHEFVPDSWLVDGTTGYEFANLVNGLFLDPAGRTGLERIYRQYLGRAPSFDATLEAAKSFITDNILASELSVLAAELDRISEKHWSTRDYTGERLRAALRDIVMHFPVYRTYVTGRGVSAADRRDIDWAVSQARRRWRGPGPEILDFVHAALTTDLARRGGPFRRAEVVRFAMKFQQYTGPVTAKSLEDTSFYRHHLLLSLNEVGGDPRQFGVSPAAFHQANLQRARQYPRTMIATATHDTKRGEDARLRIDLLSELPEIWGGRVRRWSRLNRAFRRDLDGMPAPLPNDEYAIYQALIGSWPPAAADPLQPLTEEAQSVADRLAAYVVKAVREAKVASSWDNPNLAYEEACTAFVSRLLDVSRPNPFLSDFAAFHARIAYLGMLNALSQLVLKLTVPGVPDIYQGTELWDLALVDPDNRRAVDFAHRSRLLAELKAALPDPTEAARRLMAAWPDGRIKLSIMHRLLRLRRELPGLFTDGSYEPMAVNGARADHALAFVRRHRTDRLIVAVGRLFSSLLEATEPSYEASADWNDTQVAGPGDIQGVWTNVLTGQEVAVVRDGDATRLPVNEVLAVLPVAVLLPAPH